MPRVTFHPAAVTVQVDAGASLLDAARLADLPIRNDCGGQGACGRCMVQVRRGKVTRLKTRHEVPEGRELACRTLVGEEDVEVFLPEESHEIDLEVTLRPAETLPADYPPPGALVESVRLELPPPSLDDNVSDVRRLERELQRLRPGDYYVPVPLLRTLPGALRGAEWHPEAVLWAEGGSRRVLAVAPAGDAPRCVLAVDVGTTTVKARLLAPGAGWTASCYNSQVMFGPDVITRIIHCEHDRREGCPRLQELVVADIQRLTDALLARHGLEAADVWGAVIAGNTTMMHLLLGLDPAWIRREPYVGCAYELPSVSASAIGLRLNPAARVCCLPSVSSYVGADITSGVLATRLAEMDAPSALIDLGTNGEIVVGCREFLVCCSASAGPAFEGGASAGGTRAREGAIDSAWNEDSVCWATIGDAPPVGICGTGYIDLLAALLREGVIDKTGRFHRVAPGVRADDGGEAEYLVAPAEATAHGRDIVLTQADVDNLVRAKAAIFAAGSLLLESLGMQWEDLGSIMLAGGFGERLSKDNAVAIGLLPDVPRERICFVGNTSLAGAVMAAGDATCCRKMARTASSMTYFELSTHPDFMDRFVSACFLPHTDAEKFPSVCAAVR
jgi:uncharacterized 2Fe-2S/4Fe-4S cluster protein (DUF4445 family)